MGERTLLCVAASHDGTCVATTGVYLAHSKPQPQT